MEENRYYKVQDKKLYEEYENYLSASLNNLQIIHGSFELIENQTIDIDSIEEIHYEMKDYVLSADTLNMLSLLKNGINDVVKGLKHLNKEIQSIKEKTQNDSK